jgi:hypothetical protein
LDVIRIRDETIEEQMRILACINLDILAYTTSFTNNIEQCNAILKEIEESVQYLMSMLCDSDEEADFNDENPFNSELVGKLCAGSQF